MEDGGWLPEELTIWLEGWNFQPPSSTPANLWVGVGGWVAPEIELITNQLLNQQCQHNGNLVKTLNSFQVGEHIWDVAHPKLQKEAHVLKDHSVPCW